MRDEQIARSLALVVALKNESLEASTSTFTQFACVTSATYVCPSKASNVSTRCAALQACKLTADAREDAEALRCHALLYLLYSYKRTDADARQDADAQVPRG